MKEHTCRLEDPKKFYMFRRKPSGDVVIVVGRPHGMKKTRAQSIRYPVDKWTEEAARESCIRHKGEFHPVESVFSGFGNPISPKGLTKGAIIIGGSLLFYFLLKHSGKSDGYAGPLYPGSKYYEIIKKHAEPSIPKVMLMAIIEQESYGNPKKIKTQGGVTRYGLTGIWYDAAYRMGYRGEPEGLLEPKTNIYYCSLFLDHLIFTATRKYSEATRPDSGVKIVLGTAEYALAWYGRMSLVIDTNLPMANGYVDDINRLIQKYVKIYGYQ